jgi:hypothetical protein
VTYVRITLVLEEWRAARPIKPANRDPQDRSAASSAAITPASSTRQLFDALASAGGLARRDRRSRVHGLRTHQDLIRAEWTGQINAAITNGKLARCGDGGLCARTGNTWVRLDQ